MTVKIDLLIEQREQPDRDDGVVKHGDHGRHAINPFKPECNVNQHRAQRDQHHVDRLLPQIRADLRPDNFDASDCEISREAILLDDISRICGVTPGTDDKFIQIADQAGVGASR